MCFHDLHFERMSNAYSSFEKSLQQGLILSCRDCSGKARRACVAKTQRESKGLSTSHMKPKKLQRFLRSDKPTSRIQLPEPQKLNRYESFRAIRTGKFKNGRPEVKIERIQYGRHKDVVAKMIHN